MSMAVATEHTSTTTHALVKRENGLVEAVVMNEEVDVSKIVQTTYAHPNPREFKGRIGYACLNTVLRNQKPPVFCSRTCRLDTIRQKGMDFLKELGLQNLRDLKTLIEWNEAHGIKFMRISSELFPFASHDTVGYSLEYAKDELKQVGELAAKYNHRLTTHPGQYNQLGSPNPTVVARTIKDLTYHASMLDYMGLPPDSIMIIHMGGVYGDKEAAMLRFEENYKKLPEQIKRRLVLENDELGYSVSDLLPICQKLGIPLVLDWHHYSINPGTIEYLPDIIPAINETWTRKGLKPKQHYSESRPGAFSAMERRAHSDRVVNLPPVTDDVDLMIEAKDKEQAVFQLYKLYDLHPVDDEVWVEAGPFKPKERKTRKRKVKKAETVADEEEEIEAPIDESNYASEALNMLRRSRRKTEQVSYREVDVDIDLEESVEDVAPRKRKRETRKDADVGNDNATEAATTRKKTLKARKKVQMGNEQHHSKRKAAKASVVKNAVNGTNNVPKPARAASPARKRTKPTSGQENENLKDLEGQSGEALGICKKKSIL
ncbi:hypothetical protein VTP01DRAFT_457 [Rhizomucor pusillus]|uniref:uncharacterized protein n=1 Tax=Rhizomucor pusillus TaxID=4840 RepID=UPI0037429867